MFDEARLAVALISRLTDAEQYLLQQWLHLGIRSPLAIAGVDWAGFPEPLFEDDDPSSAGASRVSRPAGDAVLRAVVRVRSAPRDRAGDP